MNYILASALCNVSYAVGDVINGVTAKRNPPLKLALWGALYGVVIFAVPLLSLFRHDLSRLTLGSTLWIFGTGIIMILAYFSFLVGLNKGSVVLTGVIGGSFPAITAIVALVLFHESISVWQSLAILLILIGIILSSFQGSVKTMLHDAKSSAIIFALGAFLLWGIYFAVVRIPVEQVGWFLPIYGADLIGIPLYFLIAWRTKTDGLLSIPILPWLVAASTIIQFSGSMLYNYAISQGPTSIVAPIAGSSPAVFVILAYFNFRERLQVTQWVGIAAALVGVICLSLLSH